jgi:hypothetical protein
LNAGGFGVTWQTTHLVKTTRGFLFATLHFAWRENVGTGTTKEDRNEKTGKYFHTVDWTLVKTESKI